MSIDRVVDLKALHLYGMATAWSEWLAEFAHQPKPVIPEVWLDRLIAAEHAYRQSRSLDCRLRAARFPIHRDLLVSIGMANAAGPASRRTVGFG